MELTFDRNTARWRVFEFFFFHSIPCTRIYFIRHLTYLTFFIIALTGFVQLLLLPVRAYNIMHVCVHNNNNNNSNHNNTITIHCDVANKIVKHRLKYVTEISS